MWLGAVGGWAVDNGGTAGVGEQAWHWRYEALPGVDLLRARYVRKTFVRHTHEHFVIAASADGVEVFHHRGSDVVGVAVGLSGFAFGVTSAGSGLGLLQTCALSLLVFTGASQFALVGALAADGNPLTAAAGAFFRGVRNAFYGLRLSQVLASPARCGRSPRSA